MTGNENGKQARIKKYKKYNKQKKVENQRNTEEHKAGTRGTRETQDWRGDTEQMNWQRVREKNTGLTTQRLINKWHTGQREEVRGNTRHMRRELQDKTGNNQAKNSNHDVQKVSEKTRHGRVLLKHLWFVQQPLKLSDDEQIMSKWAGSSGRRQPGGRYTSFALTTHIVTTENQQFSL